MLIINGKQIKIKDLKEKIKPVDWNVAFIESYLPQLIQQEVISYESHRLKMSEQDLFQIFEGLKYRKLNSQEIEKSFLHEFKDKDIKGKSQKEIVDLIRQRQFEKAKERYIQELISRSTVKVYREQLDQGL